MNKNFNYAFEFMENFLSLPYEDSKIKMLLMIFLFIKEKYLEAYELFLQIQK
jgi:hypothetical protein